MRPRRHAAAAGSRHRCRPRRPAGRRGRSPSRCGGSTTSGAGRSRRRRRSRRRARARPWPARSSPGWRRPPRPLGRSARWRLVGAERTDVHHMPVHGSETILVVRRLTDDEHLMRAAGAGDAVQRGEGDSALDSVEDEPGHLLPLVVDEKAQQSRDVDRGVRAETEDVPGNRVERPPVGVHVVAVGTRGQGGHRAMDALGTLWSHEQTTFDDTPVRGTEKGSPPFLNGPGDVHLIARVWLRRDLGTFEMSGRTARRYERLVVAALKQTGRHLFSPDLLEPTASADPASVPEKHRRCTS